MDRWIGIPLVWLLGGARRALLTLAARPPGEIRRIGVLKENAIGDTVVLTTALRDLRARFPSAHIVLFVGSSNLAIARLLAVPDEVQMLDLANLPGSVRRLRAARLDLLFDAGQWPRMNALLSILSGSRHLVGFDTPGQCRHYGYDKTVRHRRDLHEVDNFRNLVAGDDGIPSTGLSFDHKALRFARIVEEKYVVLHQWPGGEQSELKEWPVQHWAAVGRHLAQRGYVLVLTGGPADVERNAQLALLLAGHETVNAAGLPFDQLPSLLMGAELVVSVNTGLMHLSAALGIRTVGLHGPTSIRRWGPLGPNAAAVASRDLVSQYLNLGFEYPAHCRAMVGLHPDDVIGQIDAVRTVDAASLVRP